MRSDRRVYAPSRAGRFACGRTERTCIKDIGDLLRGKNEQAISCDREVRVHGRAGKKVLVNLASALQAI